MLYRELLTATIAGRGYVLQHQPISEAKIILEFLLRQLLAIKAMRYSDNTFPIPRFPTVKIFILDLCLLLLFKYLGDLDGPFTKSCRLAGLTYACPMAYVVEDGTS